MPPSTLPAILLDTAAVLAALPPPTAVREPSHADVLALLSRLPALAAAARSDDPACRAVILAADLSERPQQRLADAAVRVLEEAGVRAVRTAGRLLVDLPSLLSVAAALRTAEAAQALVQGWRALAGPAATATVDAHAGTVTLAAPLDGRHVVAPGWAERATGEVVEEGRAALGLPSWAVADVAAAWRARAGVEALCSVKRGLFRGSAFLPADDFTAGTAGAPLSLQSALCFSLRPASPLTCFALTPATCEASIEALVERAALAFGLPASAHGGNGAEPKRSLRARSAGVPL